MHQLKHPLAKIAYPDWIKLQRENTLSNRSADHVQFIEKTSQQNEKYRLEEAAHFDEALAATTIHESPVFVIGHWRSGTTHLQNILTQDDRFGYLNVVQSLNPHAFLTRESEDIAAFKETKRFMDNVVLTGKAPSEEEVALGILSKGSFWHGYYLTDKMDYYFDKFTLFNNIDDEELMEWKKDYLHLLKKLSFRHQGKPLFLKNPPNTCRIKVLLELFPKAKFIHIRRNPYNVYFSRMKQFETAVQFKSLQEITREEWERKVFDYYRKMMQKHFDERDLIPKDQYIEVSFEDLKKAPIQQLKTIYQHLDLGNFQPAKIKFEKYLEGLQSYQQNKYAYDPKKLEEIYAHWNFTIDKWNYQKP